jgi:hypothetical protein
MADVPGTAANLLKALKSIDPELRKQFVRRVKEIGKPVNEAIKSNLPTASPLIGMNNSGRLGWGVGQSPTSTTLAFKSTGSKTAEVTPLLSVKVNSAASSVVDMAGRRSSGNTSSGRAMIAKLNSIRNASRYVYPAGLAASKNVEAQIQTTIEEASAVINERYK